jgi:hypothetical protein
MPEVWEARREGVRLMDILPFIVAAVVITVLYAISCLEY